MSDQNDRADPVVTALAQAGIAARKTSTKEVSIYLKEYDKPAAVTAILQQHDYVLHAPKVLPERAEFGVRIGAEPIGWYTGDDE